MSIQKHRFNYMMIVYDEPLSVREKMYGWIRAKNKEEAKARARELWNRYPDDRRWIVVVNEKGTEIVNYSNKPK